MTCLTKMQKMETFEKRINISIQENTESICWTDLYGDEWSTSLTYYKNVLRMPKTKYDEWNAKFKNTWRFVLVQTVLFWKVLKND